MRNRTFFSIGEANRAIAPLLQALNQKEMQHMGKSRKELFEELDQPALHPLPERPYEYAAWKTAKVNIDYHVEFDGHFYSVPYILVRQEVRVHATESLVAIFHNGKQVAVHPRSQAKGRFSTRSEHMPSKHQFVAGMGSDWLLKEAETIGPQTKAYFAALLKARQYPQQAYRSCLGILDLSRRYTRPQIETACQVLLTANLLSYRDLKSELERLTAQATDTVLPTHENVRGSTYYQ
jgi:transposase